MRLRRYLAALTLVSLALGSSVLACGSLAAPPTFDAGEDARGSDAPPPRADVGPPDSASDATERDAMPQDSARSDATDGSVADGPDVDDGTTAEAGPASLAALRVFAADASSTIELTPAFSPDVFDYYVRCVAGVNALTVSMTASPGAESMLTKPSTSPPSAQQTLSVRVNEGAAIVAVATAGTASTEYWVRCLPHDFPHPQVNAHPALGLATPGYYMIANVFPLELESSYAMVLDQRGVPVWYDRGVQEVFNADDVVPGAVSFIAGAGYQINFLSPLSMTHLPVMPEAEHELRYLANGDYLVTTAPLRSGVNLTGLSLPNPGGGGSEPLGPNSTIADCDLVELDPKGKVVWTWVGSKHLDAARDSTWPQPFGPAPDGGTVIDVFHCNSIDVDPANGNLLVSGRHMDSVFYVEKSSGNILWKMGGASYTKDHAAFVPVVDPFHRQHDARLQPGWTSTCSGASGQISVFDDETAEPGPARAILYNVSVDYTSDGGAPRDGGTGGDCGVASDAGVSGATLAWEYVGTTISEDMGSFRILADGSRIIDWGDLESGGHTAMEIDVAGNDILDVDVDFMGPNVSYRTVKIPLTAFDIELLRNTAGQ